MTKDQLRLIGLPDRRAALTGFSRAASTFDDMDVIHSEARSRMLDRLPFFELKPRRVLDLGSATGKGTAELAALYPAAQVIAVELSMPMAGRTRSRCVSLAGVTSLVGDAEQLPLLDDTVDLIFANLVLPWCDPQVVFQEAARVLCDGGLMVFTTVGPDTLQEIRRAWTEIDDNVHVHGFVDMHDLGDIAARAGLTEPVMDVDRLRLTYSRQERLFEDLKATGATNAAFGRRLQLTSTGRWKSFCAQLEACRVEGRLSISVELIFGLVWGLASSTRRYDKTVSIPIEEVAQKLPSGSRSVDTDGTS
jgi:malonyl-CoA O-methyltransferase|tara:strand:+ start:25 stop:942 length:918 start_codon:yes stop_codon:yes gene_type:complete